MRYFRELIDSIRENTTEELKISDNLDFALLKELEQALLQNTSIKRIRIGVDSYGQIGIILTAVANSSLIIEKLDLSATTLYQQQIDLIARLVQENRVTELDLSFCKIRDVDFVFRLCGALAKSTSLLKLNLAGEQKREFSVWEEAASFLKKNVTLEKIELLESPNVGSPYRYIPSFEKLLQYGNPERQYPLKIVHVGSERSAVSSAVTKQHNNSFRFCGIPLSGKIKKFKDELTEFLQHEKFPAFEKLYTGETIKNFTSFEELLGLMNVIGIGLGHNLPYNHENFAKTDSELSNLRVMQGVATNFFRIKDRRGETKHSRKIAMLIKQRVFAILEHRQDANVSKVSVEEDQLCEAILGRNTKPHYVKTTKSLQRYREMKDELKEIKVVAPSVDRQPEVLSSV